MTLTPARRNQGSLGTAIPRPVYGGGQLPPLWTPSPPLAPRAPVSATWLSLDGMISVLLTLAVVTLLGLSSSILTNWKIHYLTAGGNFLEKLHPSTYLTCLAFALLLIRGGDPIGQINRIFSDSKLVLVYLLCWAYLAIQMFVLDRPFTVIIDTFLLPVILCLIVWQMPRRYLMPPTVAFHGLMLINVVLGYYEYLSGHRLVPLTLGSVVVFGEWRSAALLGHPLTASGIVGAYVIALALRPSLIPQAVLRLPILALSFASLMVFGGRTALVTVLVVLSGIAGSRMLHLLRGGRTTLPATIATICLLFAGAIVIFAAFDSGIFDKMLLRFSSDKGSAMARLATFNMLSHFGWSELILGPDPARVNALQAQLGLNYGIENFWISCIVQFGLVHTILITIGLACLLAEILMRSQRAAWAILLLITVIAASSVSFSSKNIQLTQFVALILLLLPRNPSVRPAAVTSQASQRSATDRRYGVRYL
ncbi:MAG: VpsF family polysaccharide biosynthesis protein [Afipia sp.]